MPTVTRLTSNGVFQSSGGFDEVSLNSGSIQFNYSANSYLQISSSTAFNFGTNDFTIEAFVYQTSRSQANVFSPQNNNCNIFIRASDGRICFYDGVTVNNSTTNLNLNSWNHIALVRSGTNIDMYLNGVNILTGLTNSTNYSQTFARIGNSSTSINGFTGYISNLRVLKGVALYTSNFQVLNSPLPAIPNTELLVLANPQNQLKDSSNNNFTITSSNTSFNTIGSFYYPANTSINLANTNNNPLLGSNTNIITTTTNTGVVMVSGGFDEVSLNSGSIKFSGTDWLTLANTAALQIPTADFTVETFVYCNTFVATGQGQILLGKGLVGTGTYEHNFILANSGGNMFLQFGYSTTGSNQIFLNSSTIPITLNSWNHLAYTRTGTNLTFWFNGVSYGTFTVPSTMFTSSGLISIASNSTGAYNPLNGYISNLRFVNGTNLYTSNFTPPTSPLLPIANTALLLSVDPQNPFGDSSVNNLTVTKNGTPIFNTLGPFYFPGNTSINLANTNNNPILGSNTNIINSIVNTGIMIVHEFDEVSSIT